MTTVRTRRLAAASTLLLALSLSGCGTGGDAATNQQYQPGVGANLRTGDVQLYNALLVESEDGTVALSAGLLNTTDTAQTLESVSLAPADGGSPVTVEPAADVALTPGQLFTIGRAGEVAGVETDDLVAGRYATLTLTFSGAGEVSIEAPVVARSETYASVAEEPTSTDEEAAAAEGSAAEQPESAEVQEQVDAANEDAAG